MSLSGLPRASPIRGVAGRRRQPGVVLNSSSEQKGPQQTRRASEKFSLGARLRSFGHAFRGIASLLRSEHNAWIHALAMVSVVLLAFAFRIDRGEWLALSLAIALVWTAEALNTSIETLSDVVSPEYDPRIKRVKDVAAGGVLCSAIGALVVGLVIFAPRLWSVAVCMVGNQAQ